MQNTHRILGVVCLYTDMLLRVVSHYDVCPVYVSDRFPKKDWMAGWVGGAPHNFFGIFAIFLNFSKLLDMYAKIAGAYTLASIFNTIHQLHARTTIMQLVNGGCE